MKPVFVALLGLLIAGWALMPAAGAREVTSCRGGVDFAGRTPTPAQLSRHSLRCADLRAATLNGLNFSQADLSGADMAHAVVLGSDFTQATLTGVNLTGARLTGSTFDQASMRGVVLAGVRASHASFVQVDLQGVSLAGADLRETNFEQASLASADLAHSDLRDASLDQADLAHADLVGADIAAASLSQATTDGADVTDLRGLTPIAAFAAILTLLLALLTLASRPGQRTLSPASRPASATAVRWVAVVVSAALCGYEISAVSGWQPTSDDLFVLPMLTPIIFLGIFTATAIRRSQRGQAAALITVFCLAGFFLITSAGLSVLGGPAFGVFPFATAPRSAAQLFGAADTPLGILLGAAILALFGALARRTALATAPPDLTAWRTLQTTPEQSWNMPNRSSVKLTKPASPNQDGPEQQF